MTAVIVFGSSLLVALFFLISVCLKALSNVFSGLVETICITIFILLSAVALFIVFRILYGAVGSIIAGSFFKALVEFIVCALLASGILSVFIEFGVFIITFAIDLLNKIVRAINKIIEVLYVLSDEGCNYFINVISKQLDN